MNFEITHSLRWTNVHARRTSQDGFHWTPDNAVHTDLDACTETDESSPVLLSFVALHTRDSDVHAEMLELYAKDATENH